MRILRPTSEGTFWRVLAMEGRPLHFQGGTFGGPAMLFYGPTLAAAVREMRRWRR